MYVFVLGTCKDVFERAYGVNSRFGVCHADDGGKTAFCRGKGTGMDIFFVSKSRVTEMYMCINKSRCDSQTGKIKNFFIIFGRKIFSEFDDRSVLNADVHRFVGFCSRINKMTIFQKHNFALLTENIKISIEETGELCQVDRTLRFRNNY